jgi:oxygen-independent coproporphyrinogen-3 oxidase
VRGHATSAEDRVRADMIEMLMCRFELDLDALSARHGLSVAALRDRVRHIPRDFPDHVEVHDNRIRLTENARLVARLIAAELDEYAMPEGRHSRAL